MATALVLGLLVLMLVSGPVALIDALRQPSERWRAAGESKLNWALLIWIGNPVGPLLYFVWVRRKLKRFDPKARSRSSQAEERLLEVIPPDGGDPQERGGGPPLSRA